MHQSYAKEKYNPNLIRVLKIMRLILAMVFTCIFTAIAGNSYSQETKLSLEMKNTTIREVLHEVERKSEFIFIFNNSVKPSLDKQTSIKSKSKSISQILDELFAGSKLSYKIIDKQIVIYEGDHKASPETVKDSEQVKISIKGNVTDIGGNPLVGVTVKVKGTQNGVITDLDGKYVINVTGKNLVLEYSYVGFNTIEEIVDARKIINVVMTENVESLGEVVVVAYGNQKKESVVGSITTVTPGKLKVGTTRSLSNNLAGTVSGIIGVQRSGEPGYDNSSFWIRGISTFQGARNPLVLVDGIERSLNNIDIEEIESFSVLKDAAASAVYGVRGANGVILINTKRGKIGKPSITVKSEFAQTAPVRLPDFIGAADYMQVLDDIRVDSDMLPLYTNQIAKTRSNYDPDLYPDVDWIDAISKDHASNMRTTLDISGGSERLRYSFVAAYYGEKGILARDNRKEWDSSIKVQRYNVRSNVDMNLTPTTLIRFNIGGYLQERTAPPQGIQYLYYEAFVAPPFIHPKQYSSGQIPNLGQSNPWAKTTQTGFTRSSSSQIETLFSLEQDLKILLPGLKATGIFSFDRYSSNSVTRSNKPNYYQVASGRNDEGDLIVALRESGSNFLGYETGSEWGSKRIYLEGRLTYNQTFGSHAVEGLFLYNQSNYDNGSAIPYRNQGIAGRASYTYGGKYIGEFNFGYNGSENFAKGQRFGFFPSIAVGWIVSEEPFMNPVSKTISKLKLRLSHGLVGNDQLEDRRFAYLATIEEIGGYTWGHNKSTPMPGYSEGHFANPSLTWETVKKTNLGLELSLFKGMVDLQADYFMDKRSDIFMQRRSIPSTGGYIQTPWSNFGKVNNHGIELSLGVNKQLKKDLFVSFFGSFTYAKNKIIEIDESISIIGSTRAETGHPVGQWFGLLDDGFFTDADFADVDAGILADGIPAHTYGNVRPGDIKYKDLNNDNRIDDLDRTAIKGTLDPQLVYGLGLNIQYQNLDFGAMLQGNGKTYNMLDRNIIPGSGNGAKGNIFSNVNDRWTAENTSHDAFYPRLSLGLNTNNSQESTWWLKDMSMLRVKNIEVGYSIPQKIISQALLSKVRVFFRGANLFTFSRFKLWDPEIKEPQGGQYPIMKSLSFGIEIGF